MKLKTIFASLACVTVVMACNKFETQEGQNLYLNLGMTGVNHPTTKVGATEATTGGSSAINFTWQATDNVNLTFEQGGKYYTTTAKPTTAGQASSDFSIAAPIQMNLATTYSLYGALNTTITPNSSTFVTLTGTSIYQTLADAAGHLPFIFSCANVTGTRQSATLSIDASMLKVIIVNETGRPITLSDNLTVTANGQTWKFTISTPVNVAANSTVTVYAPIYGEEKAVATPCNVSGTFNTKVFTTPITKVPTDGKFAKGKCYALQLKYNVLEEMTGNFVLPSMPIENLFD